MQKPFTLTPEMAQELNDDLASLAPKANAETHDSVGESFGPPRLRRRTIDRLHSEGLTSGSQHDQKVFNEEAVSAQALGEDPINPSHYRKHPSGIECIDIARHMNFNAGNAIKYIWRYMDKGDPVENLKKAQWYLDDEIRRLQGVR